MTNNVKIYFSDLNEKGQKKALDAAGVTDPKECNWDMDIIPLAEFDIEIEDDNIMNKEDFIQAVKVENLNEQVEQDSYVKTVEERAFARGWNACQREILNNIDKVLLPSIIAE